MVGWSSLSNIADILKMQKVPNKQEKKNPIYASSGNTPSVKPIAKQNIEVATESSDNNSVTAVAI